MTTGEYGMEAGAVAAVESGMPREQRVDRADLAVAIVVGCVFALIKGISLTKPEWRVGSTDALAPCIITLGYILYRARRRPEKLDEWGITTPLTPGAIVGFLLLLAISIGTLAAVGSFLGGGLPFERAFPSKMLEYTVSAFPQQFFLCSVGLVTLAKWPPLRGHWRLPLATGALFGLAHFWTPVHFPGTALPIQVVGTFPMGFLAAYYFLRFRTILPLTALHAILFVLFSAWVEGRL